LGDNLFFRVAESFLEYLETLELKIANLTAGTAFESHAKEDLCVVRLVLKFTRRPRDLQLYEFVGTVNSVARMGSWADDD